MPGPELSPRALIQAARQLREEFAAIQGMNPHSGESGAEAEGILKKFLKDRAPRRFDVESGVVIGTVVSRQTDLIVTSPRKTTAGQN
jgi:4-hydroxy-L-threonine phosphate dehydrogenase PdxA